METGCVYREVKPSSGTRNPDGGYPPSIRRISGNFADIRRMSGDPADIRQPDCGFRRLLLTEGFMKDCFQKILCFYPFLSMKIKQYFGKTLYAAPCLSHNPCPISFYSLYELIGQGLWDTLYWPIYFLLF